MTVRRSTTNTVFRTNLQALIDRIRARRGVGAAVSSLVRPPTPRLTRKTTKVTPGKGGRGKPSKVKPKFEQTISVHTPAKVRPKPKSKKVVKKVTIRRR